MTCVYNIYYAHNTQDFKSALTSDVEKITDAREPSQSMFGNAFIPPAVFPSNRGEIQETIRRLLHGRIRIILLPDWICPRVGVYITFQ